MWISRTTRSCAAAFRGGTTRMLRLACATPPPSQHFTRLLTSASPLRERREPREEELVEDLLREPDDPDPSKHSHRNRPWTKKDTGHLLAYVTRMLPLKYEVVGSQLDRSLPNLRGEVQRLLETVPPALFYSESNHPDTVPLGEYERSVFAERMRGIIGRIFTQQACWLDSTKAAMGDSSPEEWVQRLTALIPPHVQRFLAAPTPPPSLDAFRALGWQDTSHPGIYARLSSGLFISSATHLDRSMTSALEERQWVSGRYLPPISTWSLLLLRERVIQRNLVTLAVMPPKEDPQRIFPVVKMVLMIWLGALKENPESTQSLLSGHAWITSGFPLGYRGECKQSPLPLKALKPPKPSKPLKPISPSGWINALDRLSDEDFERLSIAITTEQYRRRSAPASFATADIGADY